MAFSETISLNKLIEESISSKLLYEISNYVEIRSKEDIQKYISSDIKVGVVLFDRERKIRSISQNSQKMFSKFFTL